MDWARNRGRGKRKIKINFKPSSTLPVEINANSTIFLNSKLITIREKKILMQALTSPEKSDEALRRIKIATELTKKYHKDKKGVLALLRAFSDISKIRTGRSHPDLEREAALEVMKRIEQKPQKGLHEYTFELDFPLHSGYLLGLKVATLNGKLEAIARR
ncbi:MAG TPA: hypothetical protein VJG83_06995 [archaeon]|nr:hypothetical protein [archaeon]